MAYELKDGEGSLFKNERKESETHADYTGQSRLGGVEYWASYWIKETKDGKKYMKVSYKPKQETAAARKAVPFDDEISFEGLLPHATFVLHKAFLKENAQWPRPLM